MDGRDLEQVQHIAEQLKAFSAAAQQMSDTLASIGAVLSDAFRGVPWPDPARRPARRRREEPEEATQPASRAARAIALGTERI